MFTNFDNIKENQSLYFYNKKNQKNMKIVNIIWVV